MKPSTAPCRAITLPPALAALPPLASCEAVSDVLQRIGDKWSLLVVYLLSQGRVRFSELKRLATPISQKVLTATLRGLERDGYAARFVTDSVPARVDYELTPLGHAMLGPVTALATFAWASAPEVEAARRDFDGRA